MKAKLKSILAIALCAVGLAAAAGLAPVEYLDWDDVEKKMTNAVCTAYEVVTAYTATFAAGKTYVVTNDVTNASVPLGITVEGTVANPTRLILCDGAKLTVTGQVAAETAGLNVSNGTAIVICGQKLGTGELVATGGDAAAGIGGNARQAGGMVTINGGTVTATGVLYGAGIGGGLYGAGGTVTINGGTVTATAGTDGEKAPTVAIGCCQQSGDNGTVTFGAGKWIVKQGDVAPGTNTTAEAYAADHSAKYAHIEPLQGCEDNPWKVGGTNGTDSVVAWTNGTDKLVIEGAGVVADISAIPAEIKGGVTAITVADATVTGAADGVFAGFSDVALTLPDGWQGELPDEDGNWYGARNVSLPAYPLAVKNVTFRQRYPWNGKVDVSCDLTGAGEVTLTVTVFTNGAKLCEATALAGETTIDLDAADGVKNGVKFVWNAAADLPAGFKASGVKVKVTAEK